MSQGRLQYNICIYKHAQRTSGPAALCKVVNSLSYFTRLKSFRPKSERSLSIGCLSSRLKGKHVSFETNAVLTDTIERPSCLVLRVVLVSKDQLVRMDVQVAQMDYPSFVVDIFDMKGRRHANGGSGAQWQFGRLDWWVSHHRYHPLSTQN